MHYLIIDTCVWIDLCNDEDKEVREKLSDLVKQGKVKLILPQLVIEEWERNKQSKIIDYKKASFRGMIKNAKKISEYIPQEDSSCIKRILEKFQQRIPQIEQAALEEIKVIEYLYNYPSTIKLQIEGNVKLQAVEFALLKKAPFKNKNCMADALILLSAVDYINRKQLKNCIFVSRNTSDFSSTSNTLQIHEDLQALFEKNEIKYFVNIGLAINEVEKGLISNEEIRKIEEELQNEKLKQFLQKSGLVSPDMEFIRYNSIFQGVLLDIQRQLMEITKSSVFKQFHDQIEEIAKSPFMQVSLDAQRQIEGFTKSLAAQGICDAQRQIEGIANSPALKGILDVQRQSEEFTKLLAAQGIFDAQRQIEGILNSFKKFNGLP